MEKLIGITELRAELKQVIDDLADQPVTIISRSKPVGVLIHPDRYRNLLERLDDYHDRLAIAERAGDVVELDVALKELRS